MSLVNKGNIRKAEASSYLKASVMWELLGSNQ